MLFINIKKDSFNLKLDIDYYRKIWFNKSYLFDQLQTEKSKAKERFDNISSKLSFQFPKWFKPNFSFKTTKKIKAAIIRDKGSNSEREMAFMMSAAGFNVKDIHMTDIISGRESLEDIQLLVAVGGFSNSDVLGSAKGWAGSFIFNPIANYDINLVVASIVNSIANSIANPDPHPQSSLSAFRLKYFDILAF